MYETTGSITVDGSGLTDEAVIGALESALENQLDVHPSDINISYDSESGVVTYTISSDDAESLNDVIADMQEDAFEENIKKTTKS